jgi:hypothetical protein
MESQTIEKRKSNKASTDKSSKNVGKNALEKTIGSKSAAPNKVIELGVFVDSAALSLFMPYLGAKEYVKLRELILAFVNAVRKYPKLKGTLDLRFTIKFIVDASTVPSS